MSWYFTHITFTVRVWYLEQGYLPQTCCASAFAVDRVKIFLTSILINIQTLVVVSHTVRACRKSQNFGGRWGPALLGRGRGWPLEICFSHLRYYSKFGHSRSHRTRGYNWGIPRKMLSHRARPFKVTQGHWNRYGSIGCLYDFLLVSYSNHVPVSYRFRDKKRYLPYSPTPCI